MAENVWRELDEFMGAVGFGFGAVGEGAFEGMGVGVGVDGGVGGDGDEEEDGGEGERKVVAMVGAIKRAAGGELLGVR